MIDEGAFRRGIKEISRDLQPIWPEGRNLNSIAGDGPHYTLNGFDRPVSIGRIEAATLKNIAELLPVASAFEIGTGFGYSSLWIGAGMALSGREHLWLTSLDAQTEGRLHDNGRRFAQAAAETLGLSSIIHYVVGSSPADVPAVLTGRMLDLVFIDGNHHGEQPLADYKAVRNSVQENGLLLFHDVEPRYSVSDAISASLRDGWSFAGLPTSCRLGACYRTPRAFDCLLEAFHRARTAMQHA